MGTVDKNLEIICHKGLNITKELLEDAYIIEGENKGRKVKDLIED